MNIASKSYDRFTMNALSFAATELRHCMAKVNKIPYEYARGLVAKRYR
jgi:hypothetical protein